jgi:uncharacterized protein (TIGR02444 family)
MDRRTDYTMSNPLWDYSLATYSLDGVAPTCLVLQDTFGLDVNLLLYAAWLAHMERRLSRAHLIDVEGVVADWRENVVQPLRILRRQLCEYPGAAGLCKEIKALELRTEQQQQDMMYAFFQRADGLPQVHRPLQENMALVAQFASPDDGAWVAAIGHLATLFSDVRRG